MKSRAGTTQPSAAPEEDAIEIVRFFAAPRALVFQAWTDPAHLVRWFAPHGCTTPHCTVDPRPGGRFHICMRFPDGRDIWVLGIYREVVPPERLVYSDTFADADGNPVPPTHYGMSPSIPAESLVTVTFAERDGKTVLTLRHALPAAFPERDDTARGWSEMLERLNAALAPGGHAAASPSRNITTEEPGT